MSADAPATNPRPARGYSWPPAEPGNLLALKHGAWSQRKVEPIADHLVERYLVAAAEPGTSIAYLADPSFEMALRRWASLEARCHLVRTWLDAQTDEAAGRPGDLDADGEVRPAADLLVKLEAQAAKAAERLGLDPLSRSKLGRNVATTQANVAAAQAAGAAALDARTHPATTEDDDHDPDA